jgi:hypothetical protein
MSGDVRARTWAPPTVKAQRSALSVPRIGCFDPWFSLACGAGLLVAAVALVSRFPSFATAAAALIVSCAGFLLIARGDARRVVCVSLVVDDLLSGDVEFSGDRATVVCVGGAGSVGRLSRRLRRRGVVPMQVLWRRLPVALVSADNLVRFGGPTGLMRLEGAEVGGAVSLVDSGVGKRLEIVFASRSLGPPQVAAVRFSSSEGVVESFSSAFPYSFSGSG